MCVEAGLLESREEIRCERSAGNDESEMKSIAESIRYVNAADYAIDAYAPLA
jgi:hypothetical protein